MTLYKVKECGFGKDPTGNVYTTLVLLSADSAEFTVEVPYCEACRALQEGSEITATVHEDNRVSLQLPNGDDLTYGIGKSTTCPFCRTTLINIQESNTSKKYCFNVGCSQGQDQLKALYSICTTLRLGLTEQELFHLAKHMDILANTNDVHLVSIFYAISSLQKRTPFDISILQKLKAFLIGCTPSYFLKMLNIPDIYEEIILAFDSTFDTIEDFYYAMHNYRDLNPTLVAYDSSMMGLIYLILTINKEFITKFLDVRQILKAASI